MGNSLPTFFGCLPAATHHALAETHHQSFETERQADRPVQERKTRTMRRLSLVVLLSVVVCPTAALATNPPKPNIIHIFADDLGKGSLGYLHQNARAQAGLPAIKTPHLDALAGAGMDFERAYSATVCSPSRGMLYLGFNQAHNANDRNTVVPRAQDVTLADVLKQANYTTSVYGKWGFGGTGGDLTGPKKDSLGLGATVNNTDAVPTTQGYDEFTGYLNHSRAHRYFVDYLWTTDDTGNPQTAGLSELSLGNDDGSGNNLHATYTHDVIAARSEQFIEDHYQDADPFFMQVNYTIPHNDLEAIQFLPGWFDDYNGVDTSDWTNLEKYYAAMITRMDSSIGSLIAKLEDPDGDPNTDDSIMDNTMIVFTSDNGATDRGFPHTPPEEPGLEHFGIITGSGDPNDVGYLRGGKRDLWEGGIQMPQIVRWDGVVTPGSTTDHQTDLTDFMATVAELAGVQAPVGIDGHSLAPLLTGNGIQRKRDYLIFEHHEGDGPDGNGLNPRWAIIRGDYKLIEFSNNEQRLYNLATDPDENNQLDQGIPANAALVSELTSIALAEGVEQPEEYDHQYAAWTGNDGDLLEAASNWNLGTAPHPTWSTTVNNTSGSPAVATAETDVDTLGFEVQGDNGMQTVRVNRYQTLTGRNAVRINAGGRVNLDDAALVSWRWTDVHAGGQLTGHGTVEGDVYNLGTIAPGVPADLPEAPATPQPPQGVDTGIVSAIVFDFTGIQDVAPLTQTSTLNQYLQINEGFNLGPGIQVRHTTKPGSTDVGDEFNVTGFSGNNTTVSNAIANNDYLGFKVEPVFGIEMLVDQISIQLWRNGPGAAQEYAILTNLDGFSAGNELATLNTAEADTSTHVLTGNYTGGVWTQDEVDVRIYGWDQEGGLGNTHFNAVSMTASFRTITGGGPQDVTLNPTGTLSLNGDFFHLAGAMIEMELGGTNVADPNDPEYDQLLVSGDVDLAGDLLVSLVDGFIPSLNDSFDLFDFALLTGAFSSVSLPSLDPGLDWDTTNLLVDGSISVVASPDFNGDGLVNGSDFLAWQRGESPTPFSQSDLLLWESSYGGGGSNSSNAATVPEPTSGCLFFFGTAMYGIMCRSSARRSSR